MTSYSDNVSISVRNSRRWDWPINMQLY